MKKTTLLVATTVPVLAQLTEEDPSELTLVPANRYNAARCPFPVEDPPATVCTVDDNGFIITPTARRFPTVSYQTSLSTTRTPATSSSSLMVSR